MCEAGRSLDGMCGARGSCCASVLPADIASPNANQPGFSHTQGCMYIPPKPSALFGEHRYLDAQSRAAKVAEIWAQLQWLQNKAEESGGPFLVGNSMSHADLTWFPTACYMEYLLPRVFDWPEVFHEDENFPFLSQWFQHLDGVQAFHEVRDTIRAHWIRFEAAGHLDAIRDDVKAHPNLKWTYP